MGIFKRFVYIKTKSDPADLYESQVAKIAEILTKSDIWKGRYAPWVYYIGWNESYLITVIKTLK